MIPWHLASFIIPLAICIALIIRYQHKMPEDE